MLKQQQETNIDGKTDLSKLSAMFTLLFLMHSNIQIQLKCKILDENLLCCRGSQSWLHISIKYSLFKKKKKKKRIPTPQFFIIPRDSDLAFVRLKHQYCVKAPHANVQPGLRTTTLVYQLLADKFL